MWAIRAASSSLDSAAFQERTALHCAAAAGSEAVVRCLVELGANMEVIDSKVREWRGAAMGFH